MRHLKRRVETLETKIAPTELKTVHLVGVLPGQTEEEARAVYGRPIEADDDVVFLVGVEPAGREPVK